jgi:uncharacterized protein (DUF2384 family)
MRSLAYEPSLNALFDKNLLGAYAGDLPDSVRKGFPYRTLVKVVKTLDLDIRRQTQLFAVSRSTLHRLAKERKRLNPSISDRIARLMRIYAEIMELFEVPEDANR